MYSAFTVFVSFLALTALLFGVALAVERSRKAGETAAASPWVYTLSLAVYCTTWTFYGSVGKAVSTGMLFLTIYIGPILGMALWWLVLRKMVRIGSRYRITSIADFISTRYDRSYSLAAMATVLAVVGMTPYIALQLKALFDTFAVVAEPSSISGFWTMGTVRVVSVAAIIAFTIILGGRRLTPAERHPGVITAVALGSLIKLAAFLACGLFILLVSRHDPAVLANLVSGPTGWNPGYTHIGVGGGNSYALWAVYLLLAMSAILFLPHQFHVAVVECPDEKHIKRAMWALPLYFVLINVFVAPIAMEGLLSGLPAAQADTFVLRLPLMHGRAGLALLVYSGGVAAGMCMVVICTMTLATMITNHLLLPALDRLPGRDDRRTHLLRQRWLAMALVILCGYWFERHAGRSTTLVNMGLISFAAVLQFAPPILAGLFCTCVNKTGARLGLGAGALLWFYTLFVPAGVEGGWLPVGLAEAGPWGIGLLRPEALLGLRGLDPLTHGVFWSLLANVALLFGGSFWSRTRESEQVLAREFVGILDDDVPAEGTDASEATVDVGEKTARMLPVLERLFGPDAAAAKLRDCLVQAGVGDERRITLARLADVVGRVETALAGVVGSAGAHKTIASLEIFTPQESQGLAAIYAGMVARLNLTPAELSAKISFHKEREVLVSRYAEELEQQVRERTRDAAQRAERIAVINRELEEQIDRREEVELTLRRRLEMERFLAAATAVFVGPRSEGIQAAVVGSLDKIGELMDVDRAYVCRVDEEAMETLFEWNAPGIETRSESVRRVPCEHCPWWMGRLRSLRSIVVPDVGGLHADASREREVLEAQGVKSIVAVPMVLDGDLVGFIGLDAVGRLRDWSPEDMDVLEAYSRIMVGVLEGRRMQDALRRNERKYRDLVENLSEGIWLLDGEGTTMFANPSLARMLGCSLDDLEGASVFDFLDESHRDMMRDRLAARQRGKSEQYETEFERRGGGKVFAFVSASPFLDEDGEYLGSRALVTDMTHLKELRQELLRAQKLESIGQLAAGIAHEINTPTQYVINNLDFLQEAFAAFGEVLQALDPLLEAVASGGDAAGHAERLKHRMEELGIGYFVSETPDSITDSMQGLERVTTIVKGVKQFAYPSSGTMESVDINEAIRSTITVSTNEWKYVADLDADLDPDLPLVPLLLGEFNQVLLNLITNAAQAIGEGLAGGGKGRITVSTRHDGDWVEVRVADNGPGIGDDIRERIFDPFFTTKPVGKGSGQGLSICHTIVVEKHKGAIACESEPGRGSTFIIRLPLGAGTA